MRATRSSRLVAVMAMLATLGGLCGSLALAQGQDCQDTPEGRICRVTQPLVNGVLVDVPVQRDLGLVTVGRRCSGTLVNRYWVLTADHCVSNDGTMGGPDDQLRNLNVTAAWTNKTAVPARMVRNWWGRGIDIALLFLGSGDLGRTNVQLLFVDPPDVGSRVTAYGRGIHQLATAGPPPARSVGDGRYRSAVFALAGSNENAVSYSVNEAGQIGAGGDSGGPDIVNGPGGVALGIAGVHSNCGLTRVPGMVPNTGWTWVDSVSACSSAGVMGVRSELIDVMRETKEYATQNDFDDDNRADILWWNESTGEMQIWFMDSFSRIGRNAILGEDGNMAFIGPPWRIVGSRGYDLDRTPDILWYNEMTGETQIWHMIGSRLASRATVLGLDGNPAFIGPPFSIVATNDMNSDGWGDIVWHNAQSGETQIWYMSDNRLVDRGTVLWEDGVNAALVGLPWSIKGSADYSDDGRPDLLWHNAETGETQVWVMNAHRIVARAPVLGEDRNVAFIGPPFHIMNANDYDGDGNGDILWHNEATGELQIWYLAGRDLQRRATVEVSRDGGDGQFILPPWRIMRH